MYLPYMYGIGKVLQIDHTENEKEEQVDSWVEFNFKIDSIPKLFGSN